ncbi:hypothetical protein GTA08_BOTSDO13652 [Botryosphaeria dothidea]|uniref:GH64 domain-containing protein n=1 Tax=Botryosphaeria dothidea TaxID=55169 RepID=A0A8H4J4M3_9PEZI|nr:hypothetical protein GTA08_BOTSDO13652 [Botryosphaeria dothidea]
MGSKGNQEVFDAVAADQHIALHNSTQASNVHAYVVGTAPSHNNDLFFLRADGQTPYYPADPGQDGGPLKQDCAIKLGEPGSTTQVTIPYLVSGRIYFAIGKLQFSLSAGPQPVYPSPTVAKNHDVRWGFAEFTWTAASAFANLSNVDLVGLPIGLALQSTGGDTQKTPGLPAGGVAAVCKKLENVGSDGGDWAKLVQKTEDGKYLRAVAPDKAMAADGALFKGYYGTYVDRVWGKYKDEDLTLHVPNYGALTGRVANGVLTVTGGGGGPESFGQPTTAQIFKNDDGPFANSGSAKRLAIIPVLCRGFVRSTLLESNELPDPEGPKAYYNNGVTDHYAKIVHNESGKTYTFPYDDDQAGVVSSSTPQLLTFTVGGQ